MSDKTLAKLPLSHEMVRNAREWLAKCTKLDELKDFKDRAEALRLYHAKKKDGERAEKAAGIIVLRTWRRIGQVSKAMDKSPGKRTDKPVSKLDIGSKKLRLLLRALDNPKRTALKQ